MDKDLLIIIVSGSIILLIDCLISLVEMLSWPELVLDFILFTMEITSLDSTVSIYMLLIFGLCRYSLKCLFDFGTP